MPAGNDGDDDNDDREMEDAKFFSLNSTYPRLFIMSPTEGHLVTPAQRTHEPCPLHKLSRELRDYVWQYAICNAVDDAHQGYSNMTNHPGEFLPSIPLTANHLFLKRYMSLPLLRASRQLRSEALPIFFGSVVFTTGWLPALSHFVGFLGRGGCAMVRYIIVRDDIDLKTSHRSAYVSLIVSLESFSKLHHLSLDICAWKSLLPWFDGSDLPRGEHGRPVAGATPKMRGYELDTIEWSEYRSLNMVGAREFTLYLEATFLDAYYEFDRNSGSFPALLASMRANYQHAIDSVSSTAPAIAQDEDAEAITSGQKADKSLSPLHPAWQDTDNLADKTIPMYNYIRHYLCDIKNHADSEVYTCFPFASVSAGPTMRDCAFCYLSNEHCGYHAVPDQFHDEESMNRFKRLSYKDMETECLDVACNSTMPGAVDGHFEIGSHIRIVQKQVGLPAQPARGMLHGFEEPLQAGWVGKSIDKNKVKVWDQIGRAHV